MALIPGINKLGTSSYADLPGDVTKRDPDRQRQSQLDWYMDQYQRWRSLFSGHALEEKIPISSDPGKTDDHESYRWPVRYNLVKSYCLLHAGLLWGRGRTGAQPDNLSDLRVDPKTCCGTGGAGTTQAPILQQVLEYFWSHLLRPCGKTQQRASACIIKVAWNPWSPTAIIGARLETVEPEYFRPIWDLLNPQHLIAVRFTVPKAVALENYGLTEAQLGDYNDEQGVPVLEISTRSCAGISKGRKTV